jgi:ABC-2 type transport system permease protein
MSAQIHELGYREYEGERAGTGWAMLSLGLHAVQRVLGLKRAARHKVLPAIVILVAFVPAIVFVGLAVLLPSELTDVQGDYGEYYFTIVLVIALFTAFVAPEAICTDRRTGMLALYLASPLNRTTYVVSKVAAVSATMLAVTLLPQLFLLLGYTIVGEGPDGLVDGVETFGRLLISGVLIAVYFASLSAMVSSFTPRRSIASTIITMSLLIPISISGVLIEQADVDDRLSLISIPFVPIRAAFYLLGEQMDSGDSGIEQVAGSLALLTTVGLIVIWSAITWWRYQKIKVDR